MKLWQFLWTLFRNEGTKILGFAQVTVGAIVAVGSLIPPNHLPYWMIASGLLTAWRGFFNSANFGDKS